METKEREELYLNAEDAWAIITEEHLNFQTIETKIVDTWSFGNENETVFQRNADKKYFKFTWRDDTDVDDTDGESYFEDNNYIPVLAQEVFKIQKTITVYE
jgi:hypothetical protein